MEAGRRPVLSLGPSFNPSLGLNSGVPLFAGGNRRIHRQGGNVPAYFSKLSKPRFSSQMCSMMLHVGRSTQRSVAFQGAG